MKNKRIALISHDQRKLDLIDWVKFNSETLLQNKLVCTGTTGKLVKEELLKKISLDNEIDYTIDIECKNSGPFGGDAQIAAMVVEGKIDLCIFLIDDLSANPHEADIQMLLRQCRLHNVPAAFNRHSADLMITSTLWDDDDYEPTKPLYVEYKR